MKSEQPGDDIDRLELSRRGLSKTLGGMFGLSVIGDVAADPEPVEGDKTAEDGEPVELTEDGEFVFGAHTDAWDTGVLSLLKADAFRAKLSGDDGYPFRIEAPPGKTQIAAYVLSFKKDELEGSGPTPDHFELEHSTGDTVPPKRVAFAPQTGDLMIDVGGLPAGMYGEDSLGEVRGGVLIFEVPENHDEASVLAYRTAKKERIGVGWMNPVEVSK